MQKQVFIIAGPTASGKSALALSIAAKTKSVIINADSMQVYDAFPVLSAQPRAEALSKAPHRLYGTVKIPALSSAVHWQQDAKKEIGRAHSQGLLPIVVGGTGLYLETLMHGLSAMPDVAEEIREECRTLLNKIGGEAFHKKLAEIDAPTASRLHGSDTHRLIRAYEIFVATGKPLSYWQSQAPKDQPRDWSFSSVLIMPEREQLYESINCRFEAMLREGGWEEVEKAENLRLDVQHPASKTLGLRELQAVRKGLITKAEAIQKAQQASRNYAKRQYTWFKNRFLEKEKEQERAVHIMENCAISALPAPIAHILRNSG